MINKELANFEDLKSRIYTLRGVKVMLDSDLAELYQVETRRLNEQVKRNFDRFPEDFMFQITKTESEEVSRSQNAILKQGKNIKYLPYVFTEQGVAMLSGVLKSKVAVEINIRIMRAFVEIRRLAASSPSYQHLADTIRRIESRMDTIEGNHLVDNTLLSGKTTQLSKEVRKLSEAFDRFQDSNILIKRPEEGLNEG